MPVPDQRTARALLSHFRTLSPGEPLKMKPGQRSCLSAACPNLGHSGKGALINGRSGGIYLFPRLSHFGTPQRPRRDFPAMAEADVAKWRDSHIIAAGRRGTMKSKLLLINCYREREADKIRGYHDWLRDGAAAAGIDLETLEADDRQPSAGGCQAVIVSGSQKMVGNGETEAGLLEFLVGCRLPLLGICYGHQVLARAFGALVKRDAQAHLGEEEIFLNKTDPLFASFPPRFMMAESHEEIVARDNDLERSFMVVAESRSGLVETIRHREHPLYGVQFHPEKSGDLGVQLLVNFLNITLKSK